MRRAGLTSKLLLSIGIMSMAGAACAEEVDLLSLSLEELMQTKVTSSTLTEESLQTVPSSMTLFTRAEIRRLGLQNLSDLVNLIPGFQSSRSDSFVLNQTVSSRGRRLGNTGSEILILLDGQRLNNDWSGGFSQSDSLVKLENVERVEFIRGPGSSIYGSNAVMGVINIVTGSQRELAVESGDYGRRKGSVSWRWQNDVGSLAIYASTAESRGEKFNIFDPFSSATAPVYVPTRDPYAADDVYLSAALGEFSLNARFASRDMEQFYVAGYVDKANNFYRTDSNSVNLGWQHNFAQGFKLEGHVFTSYKEFELQAAASLTPYLIIHGGIDEQEHGTQWTLQGNYDKAHWMLGWEWRNPALIDTEARLGPPTNRDLLHLAQSPEDDRIINGFFAQLQRPLNESLALTLGLRHDGYSDFGSHLSPRIGLVQQWNDLDTFKLLYSEAFRAPSRIETSVMNSSGFEQNPMLQPETAKTAELVWLRILSKGYVATTLFNTHVQDAIVETVTPTLKRSWGNSQQSVAGVEFEWQSHWSERWQSRIAVTHMLKPVGYIHTESNTVLGGSVSYQQRRWTYSLLANFQGAKRDPNEQDIPADITTTEFTEYGGRSIYNAYVAYLTSNQMEFYVRVNNLLDKDYLLPANRPANVIGVPSSGRSLAAGMRWAFN